MGVRNVASGFENDKICALKKPDSFTKQNLASEEGDEKPILGLNLPRYYRYPILISINYYVYFKKCCTLGQVFLSPKVGRSSFCGFSGLISTLKKAFCA